MDDFDDDLNRLQEYTVLMKQFVVALTKRLKHAHPNLSQCLLKTFMFAQYSLAHDLDVAVAEFDRMYPELGDSVIENMLITHHPSHKHWEAVQDHVVDDAQAANFKVLLKSMALY